MGYRADNGLAFLAAACYLLDMYYEYLVKNFGPQTKQATRMKVNKQDLADAVSKYDNANALLGSATGGVTGLLGAELGRMSKPVQNILAKGRGKVLVPAMYAGAGTLGSVLGGLGFRSLGHEDAVNQALKDLAKRNNAVKVDKMLKQSSWIGRALRGISTGLGHRGLQTRLQRNIGQLPIPNLNGAPKVSIGLPKDWAKIPPTGQATVENIGKSLDL